jgi:DNA-binding transcriptional LysR family regulator
MRSLGAKKHPNFMPASHQPSLLALKAFEVAARRLSFTEAARELHVSQAAISRHVRTLERDVGRELFRRLYRRVELTQAGKRFAAELASGFQQIHRAVEGVRGLVTRRLRLAVEPAFAARWLVPRLGDFSTAHPEIELELETSDDLRVLGRDADVAIRFLAVTTRRRPSPSARSHHLLSIQSVPVIAGVRPRSATRGQGIALGARALIEQELESGQLVQIGRTQIPSGDYWLLESSERSSASARSAFVRWIDGQFGQSPPNEHESIPKA